MKPIALAFALTAACATAPAHRHPHHASAPTANAPTGSAVAVDAARGGRYEHDLTCGQHHRYSVTMGANESLRATFRTSMTGIEPLGEDISWRWLGPTGTPLDTNALPVPQPNAGEREASFEVRSTYAGRYTVMISMEDGAGCAHARYSLALQ